jgi:CRP-like cAMP-binding protein/phosphoribosyl 1,2-cyclic phosphodiesterase
VAQDNVVVLPRGGLYVRTSAGAIQFGLPAETIKDSMALGLEVPTVYVVPSEPFDRRRGINVAECEFPAYYNFFLLKRRIRLLVEDAAAEARVRTVFSESLFGPSMPPQEGEFDPEYPIELRPDFKSESDHFRRNPEGKRLDVDTLVEFVRFDSDDRARITDRVVIERTSNGGYAVLDGETEIARAPARLDLPARISLGSQPSRNFEPPTFGVTVLGSSHGFDPAGKTTGFILWVGGRGLLVDPPVDATDNLREQGIPPKLIDGVILTHCHADHDSGTFQKILEEGRVNLYTTPTILGSFLKKYSALSGLPEDFLRRTFAFCPVKLGAPTRVHGAEIWFFYTLHSIPTVGFEAFYGGKSLAFSADSLFDPPRIRALQEKGVLSAARAEDLIDFPWHHTVVLHEAGVPPLHTPASVLAALPDDAKERLYVVHIAEKDVPKESGLKVAKVGLEHTIRIDVAPEPNAEAIEVLEAFCAVDLFRDFTLLRAREILQMARRRRVPAGTKIIAKGEIGDAFYIVAQGTFAVVQNGETVKTYQAGDYFGETALVLSKPRNADVIAESDAVLVQLDRYDFHYLLRGTGIPNRLVRLARMRDERSWEVFEKNSVLRALTSAQKTALQSFLTTSPVRAGEVLWRAGDPAECAYVVDEGAIALDAGGAHALAPFHSGAFVGEFDAIRQGNYLTTTARVSESGRLFEIARGDLAQFFEDNPGVLVSFLGAKFVE